jgi:hypothetical protein
MVMFHRAAQGWYGDTAGVTPPLQPSEAMRDRRLEKFSDLLFVMADTWAGGRLSVTTEGGLD